MQYGGDKGGGRKGAVLRRTRQCPAPLPQARGRGQIARLSGRQPVAAVQITRRGAKSLARREMFGKKIE